MSSQVLADAFFKIKQDSNSVTHNPILDFFEQENLKQLDSEANNDSFIACKKKNILKLIKDINIDFDSKLKSAYDEYSEAITYLLFKNKFQKVERVKEEKGEKTPDFKIEFNSENNNNTEEYTIYAELKSMSFADGDLNYKNAMDGALKAKINIESQIKAGNKVAFGYHEIQPLHKSNKKYFQNSTRYAIETLIDKIQQNIKKEQYSLGDTILIVDLKQLTLPSYFKEGAVPIFQEQQFKSYMSGVQWNVAFGKKGHLIYKQIEFEGKENTDGELEKDGILIENNFIKAIVFLDYALSDKEPKIIGLHKQSCVNECVLEFLYQFCDFVNDDRNTNGFRLFEEEY